MVEQVSSLVPPHLQVVRIHRPAYFGFMSIDDKVILKAYLKIFSLLLILVCVVNLGCFLVYSEKRERERIESEYLWFLKRARKAVVLADYMSSISSGDMRYSKYKELLEILIFEYNIKAVSFVERDKWNCIVPYQLSTVELLYRGVRRNADIRGTDMSSATPKLTVNANGTVVKAEKKPVAKKAAVKKEVKKPVKKTDFQLWSEKNAEKLKGMKPAEKLEAAYKAGMAKGKAIAKAEAQAKTSK